MDQTSKDEKSKSDLIRLLQNAYSGERAAMYAYRGHAASCGNFDERREIKKIEQEESDHRKCLGAMLAALGSGPRLSREVLMMAIGITIYCLCRLGGWLNFLNFGWYMSMYGAGLLERSNIKEYEVGAIAAIACGERRFVEELIHMAEVEWDHEYYFRSKAMSSKWCRHLAVWSPPEQRESARKVLTKTVVS
jgi:hypothetical protein